MHDSNTHTSLTGPQGRRTRPAKAALTRQGIIDAASDILRDEGVARVTMRRVAQALDTGHASLYVYVRDTEDLHAAVLDSKLAAIDTSASGASDWRTRLKALLSQFGAVLFEHPDLARMALSTRPNGPHYAAFVEAVLALLVEGGLSDRAAAWGLDVLLLYPVAVAAEHAASAADPHSPDAIDAISAQLAEVDPETHPQIMRLRDDLISGDGSSRSAWALDVLIGGIIASDTSTSERNARS